jgi:hypothetical protein
MVDKATYDKIMSRCVETPGPLDTPCMVWTGCVTHCGYGHVYIKRKVKKSHRVAYEAVYGVVEPPLCCLHKCDVRRCCNPLHLYAGTNKQNTQDASRRGRLAKNTWKAPATGKLTKQDKQTIRELYKTAKYRQLDLAIQYGVTEKTIYRTLKTTRSG